jgi:dolichyl-phosphate beta-glucosyltransferase
VNVSLVIPAYNEAARIPATISRVAEYLRSRGEPWEVIVVDDGSVDATAETAEKAAKAAALPIRVIRLPENRGKGAAVRAGVLASREEWVLVCDADLSTPIEEWEKLRDAGSTVAIGSRALDESLIRLPQPWHRRTMGKIFNKFVQLLSIRGIRDTQCGFKWFQGSLAREIFSKARIDRFAYDVEILSLARRRGAAIAEVPVVWVNSPASRVAIVSDSLRMLRDLVRIRALTRRDRAGTRGRGR